MAGNTVVLLACGSFNPPTNMHLRMFEIARDYLRRMGMAEKVFGLISPVHDSYGKQGLASSSHRLAMTKLAIEGSGWVQLSDWECQQVGHSRTVLVLRYHQNVINTAINNRLNDNVNELDIPWLSKILYSTEKNTQNVQVKLLCGADLLESFGTPGLWTDKDIEDIVGNHGLVVISRENSNPQKFIYMSDVLTKHMKNIHTITEWIKNDISSTKIRRAIRRNESVKYLLPDKVIDYIRNNKLYESINMETLAPIEIHFEGFDNLINEEKMATSTNSQQNEKKCRTPLKKHKLKTTARHRYCRGCHEKKQKSMGVHAAMRRAKTVNTACMDCPNRPMLCSTCFKERHST